MQDDIFVRVDTYINDLFLQGDPVLTRTLERAHKAGIPDIHISPAQGQYLYLMARLCAPKRILEIGTLAGFSTIWLARALESEGQVITIERAADYSAFARETFSDAGLSNACKIIEGEALDVLASLDAPFDVIFLDADKTEYPAYLTEASRLLRPGGLLLADNVIRAGAVLASEADDTKAQGAAEFNRLLADHPDFEAIIVQQVGVKGHDGLAIARRKDT